MRTLLLTLPLLSACPATTLQFEPIVVTEAVDRLDLDNGQGNVLVSAHGEDTIIIDADLHSEELEIIPSVAGGILRIQASCAVASDDCVADLELRVPEALEVRIDTSTGDITLVGMGGNAELASVDGSIEVDGFSADTLLAGTQTGITLGLRLAAEEVEVFSQAGPIDLSFEQRPSDVDVETGQGDIALVVPAGDYFLDTQASGTVNLEGVQHDADSVQVLRAVTTEGAISILGI